VSPGRSHRAPRPRGTRHDSRCARYNRSADSSNRIRNSGSTVGLIARIASIRHGGTAVGRCITATRRREDRDIGAAWTWARVRRPIPLSSERARRVASSITLARSRPTRPETTGESSDMMGAFLGVRPGVAPASLGGATTATGVDIGHVGLFLSNFRGVSAASHQHGRRPIPVSSRCSSAVRFAHYPHGHRWAGPAKRGTLAA
jgi:hypothetical protein